MTYNFSVPIFLLGEAPGGPPFNRAFFNAGLGDLLERAGKPESYRLTLFLSDGTTLEVCKLEELHEAFMVVRGYRGEDEACDLTLQAIPYGLIYRLEIAPKGTREKRLGFTWNRAAARNG